MKESFMIRFDVFHFVRCLEETTVGEMEILLHILPNRKSLSLFFNKCKRYQNFFLFF